MPATGSRGEGRRKTEGTVMIVTFHLDGQEFVALNGGPQFTFAPAISLVVNCQTQQEIDELWERLSEGGEKAQCGWLTDKYGVSWQVVPTILGTMLAAKLQIRGAVGMARCMTQAGRSLRARKQKN